jgi:hypothetical protein
MGAIEKVRFNRMGRQTLQATAAVLERQIKANQQHTIKTQITTYFNSSIQCRLAVTQDIADGPQTTIERAQSFRINQNLWD